MEAFFFENIYLMNKKKKSGLSSRVVFFKPKVRKKNLKIRK